jgi:hypothetical protein
VESEEVVLKLRNEVSPALAQINRDVAATGAGLSRTAKQASDDFRNLTARLSVAGKESHSSLVATEKMIAGMSQSGREAFAKLDQWQVRAGAENAKYQGTVVSLGGAINSFLGNLGATAVVRLTGAIGTLVADAPKVRALETGFRALTDGIGAASKGFVADMELMQSANKAILLGLPITTESMAELTRSAVTLGRAMGLDATTAVDNFITALGRSSPQILDNLGLSVKLGEANEAYARQLGKTADGLTEAERKTAFYNAALEAARVKTQQLEQQSDAAAGGIERITTAMLNYGRAAASIGYGVLDRAASFGVQAWNTKATPQGLAGLVGIDTRDAATSAAGYNSAFIAAAAGRAQMTGNRGFGVAGPNLGGAGIGWGRGLPAEWEVEKLTKETDKLAASASRAASALASANERLGLTTGGLIAGWSGGRAGEWGTLLTGVPGMGPMGTVGAPGLPYLESTMSVGRVAAMSDYLNRYGTIGAGANYGDPVRVGARFGGGGFFGGVKGGLSDLWKGASGGGGMSGLLSNIGGGLVSNLASGGLNSLISLGIGGIGKLFGGLFGGEGKKTNRERDSWIGENFGNADALRKMAAEAGVAEAEIQRLFDSKKVDVFRSAAESVTKQITEQQSLFERYGITWADFSGPEQARRLGIELDRVTGEYGKLTAAGLTHEGATRKVKDGYLAIATAAVEAGLEIPKALAPAIRTLLKMGELTKEQASALLGITGDKGPSHGDMEAAAKKYGIDPAGLGTRYQQLRSDDAMNQLAKDFDMLREGGTDVQTLYENMDDEVNELIRTSVKYGITVPDSIRDVVEALHEQGALTDADGQKLKDLSGIKFADPLISETDRLIKKLDELIEKLGVVPGAFAGVASGVPGAGTAGAPGASVPGAGSDGSGTSGPYSPDPGAIDIMHNGGMIWRRAHRGWLVGKRLAADEVPIIGQTGERVLSRAELAALGGPGGVNKMIAGGDTESLVSELRGLRSDNAALRADLRRMMSTRGMAMRDQARIAMGR